MPKCYLLLQFPFPSQDVSKSHIQNLKHGDIPLLLSPNLANIFRTYVSLRLENVNIRQHLSINGHHNSHKAVVKAFPRSFSRELQKP